MTVGGPAPADRNLISGQTSAVYYQYNVAGAIQGNLIGTDATISYSISNSNGIICVSPIGVQIGGPGANEGNVIGGSLAEGFVRLVLDVPGQLRRYESIADGQPGQSRQRCRVQHHGFRRRSPRRPRTRRAQRHRAQRRRRHLRRSGGIPHARRGQGHRPGQPLLRQPSRGHRSRPRSAAPGGSRRRRHGTQRASERPRDHEHRLRTADGRACRAEQRALHDLRRRLLRQHELRLVSGAAPPGRGARRRGLRHDRRLGTRDDRLHSAVAARSGRNRVGDRDGSSRQHVGVRADDPAQRRYPARGPPPAADP